MTRSTILLSLITLFAVGGCNAPSETIEPNSGASSQQPVEQSVDGADDSAPSAPPDSVSQPLESPNSDAGPSVVAKAENNTVDTPTSPRVSATPSTPTTDKTPVSGDNSGETSVTDNGVSEGSVTVQSAQSGSVDTTIIPGQQFSFVTSNTTYDQLEATVGASQLKTEDVHLGEGIFAPSTQVNVGSNQSFTVVWSDESRSTPLEVRDLGTGWKINGIYNGMSFQDLE